MVDITTRLALLSLDDNVLLKRRVLIETGQNWAEASERDLKMMKMTIFSLKRSQCECLSWY